MRLPVPPGPCPCAPGTSSPPGPRPSASRTDPPTSRGCLHVVYLRKSTVLPGLITQEPTSTPLCPALEETYTPCQCFTGPLPTFMQKSTPCQCFTGTIYTTPHTGRGSIPPWASLHYFLRVSTCLCTRRRLLHPVEEDNLSAFTGIPCVPRQSCLRGLHWTPITSPREKPSALPLDRKTITSPEEEAIRTSTGLSYLLPAEENQHYFKCFPGPS